MEKQFTLELITKIADTIRLSADDIIKGKVITDVDGVELHMEGRKSDFQGFFGPDGRHVVDVTYGKMILGYGINLEFLRYDSMTHNPFTNTLIEALGPQKVKLDMQDLIRLAQQNSVINALEGKFKQFTNERDTTKFTIRLPGNVVFSRTSNSLCIIKGEEEIFNLRSQHTHVIDQCSSMAAELALLTADPVDIPARIVDTSVETCLINGVLYKKVVKGEKVEFYFDDDRTRNFIHKQRSMHTLSGVMTSPTLHGHTHQPNHNGPHGYS